MRRTATALALALTGCGLLFGPDAASDCADQARIYGPEFRVVGSFSTNVGHIRGLSPEAVEPIRWPELSNNASAVLCYLDGPVAKGPPPVLNGPIPPSFDRVVIGIAGGHADMILAGYRAQIVVRAP